MITARLLTPLFQAIDARDAGAFADFLADDVVFRFGNAEAATGKDAVTRAVAGFFDSISRLHHEIHDAWAQGDTLICHGNVTYQRHDGSELTVPFANILKGSGDGIREYLIFADTSRLYTPA